MNEVVALTQDLIRFKTMHSEPQEIKNCIKFIENFLDTHGIQFTKIEHNGYPSILAMPDRRSSVKVLLMAHIDVVDGTDDLFEPVIKNGNLYGRGALDDKYAAAMALVLLKERMAGLKAEGKGQEDLPFGILITSDEETGGYNGAAKMVENIQTEFCIALDGGNPEKIVVKEKGVLTVKMIARGKAAHGSRPWLGENAVDNLIKDYAELKTLFETPTAESWCRTMNLGIIKAGKSFNQVPDRAEAIFDIRYTENDNPKQLTEAMHAKVGHSELEVMRREPMFLGGTSSYLERLHELADGAEIGFEHGASDARFFSDKGVGGIVWGAEGDSSAHAVDEHVNIDSIHRVYKIIDRFLGELEG